MSLFKKLADVNLKEVHCLKCNTKQPKVRKPKNWRQVLWGGSTCENCGIELDRFGKKSR